GFLQKVQARWHAWRDDREQKRMRRQVEVNRTAGRKPVPGQSVGSAAGLNEPPKPIQLADGGDVFRGGGSEVAEEEPKTQHKAPILVMNSEKPEKAPKKSGEPKIAKDQNYRLPSVNLLREGERSQKLDEDELKDRARAIEEKCLEFDVQGRV